MSEPQLFRDCTRATQYQAKHTLPASFSSILKEFTREVLREQPADVLQWSAEYFKRKALESDPAAATASAAAAPSSAAAGGAGEGEGDFAGVAREMVALFAAMDDTGTQRLYVHLVQRALLDHFGLTKEQALYILSSEDGATRDDDGMIRFADFARSAARAVVFFQQSQHKFAAPAGTTAVHGLERAELRDALLRVFGGADASADLGRLTFAEFRRALVRAPLQLTRRDINVLCAEAEQTSDGFVDVRREAEHAFPLLCLAREFTLFDKEAS